VKRVLLALVIGGAFVCIVEMLGHSQIATPIPFWLLSPGILVGAFGPDSGFNPEGDVHPWGPVSTTIVYAVDIGIYGGLACFILYLVHRSRRVSK
jgi:hypothetical protein